MRQSWETMTYVSAGHIILTPTQPVRSGRPQRQSNLGPPHQESRALPTELPRPPPPPPPPPPPIVVKMMVNKFMIMMMKGTVIMIMMTMAMRRMMIMRRKRILKMVMVVVVVVVVAAAVRWVELLRKRYCEDVDNGDLKCYSFRIYLLIKYTKYKFT